VGVNQGYFGHRGVPSSRGCHRRSPCRLGSTMVSEDAIKVVF
jgi:hypothetical protein